MNILPLISPRGNFKTIRGISDPKNRSKFLSKILNNRSITTNESSKNMNSNKKNKNNFQIYFPSESTISKNLNTIGTDKSTWYHTKTVSSIRKEKKKILQDADAIINFRIKHNFGKTGIANLTKSKVLAKSKELCLSNFMITQLKDKRTEINKKEFDFDMAVRNSERKFDIDYKSFIDFMENIKRKDKEEEDVLNCAKKKKDSIEQVLNEEIKLNKKLEEKCEYIVRHIILLKNYGSFLHKVFKAPFMYDNLTQAKVLGKEYLLLKNKIIHFYNLYNDNKTNNDDILDNEEVLLKIYNNYEEKLVQMIDEKEFIKKEIEEAKMESKDILNDLETKMLEHKKEYEKLMQDKKEIFLEMKEYKNINLTSSLEYLKYIIELGTEIGLKTDKKVNDSNINLIADISFCKDTINLLLQKESEINEYIEQIDNILKYGDENDKKIIGELIHERKVITKKEKQLKLKNTKDEEERRNKFKALERSRRIVIKGRKVFKDYFIKNHQKKEVKKSEIDSTEPEQYLYYSEESDKE